MYGIGQDVSSGCAPETRAESPADFGLGQYAGYTQKKAARVYV